jgi:hypothetical protein
MSKVNSKCSPSLGGLFSSSNTTITNQQSPSYANISTGGGSTYSTTSYKDDFSKYDLENKCLDLEKLDKMTESKRDMIFQLFLKFIDSTIEPQREVLYNSIKPYYVLVDKTKLDRKVKIGNVLSEKESDEE